MTSPSPIDLLAIAQTIEEPWTPLVVSELNGQLVKLALFEGSFVWHSHDAQDECFVVLSGEVTMHLRDGDVTLGPMQSITIPRGVEHRPAGAPRALVMIFEPAETRNTGDVDCDLTIEANALERHS